MPTTSIDSIVESLNVKTYDELMAMILNHYPWFRVSLAMRGHIGLTQFEFTGVVLHRDNPMPIRLALCCTTGAPIEWFTDVDQLRRWQIKHEAKQVVGIPC